jgi:hypothetical protein
MVAGILSALTETEIRLREPGYGDEHATSHSDSQAGHVDEAVQFPLHKVAPGDLEKVTEHGGCLSAWKSTKYVPPGQWGQGGEIAAGHLFKTGHKLYGYDTPGRLGGPEN